MAGIVNPTAKPAINLAIIISSSDSVRDEVPSNRNEVRKSSPDASNVSFLPNLAKGMLAMKLPIKAPSGVKLAEMKLDLS